jgi:hypothetical protein
MGPPPEGYGKGALRHPMASCRGVGGHRPSLCIPLLGTITASEFFHCPVGYLSFLGMAPKSKPAPAASADDTAAASSHCDPPSANSASDNIRLVMEQLQLLHARMDDQARMQSELLRRDALRDHPVAIDSGANPPVDGPYMPTSAFVPAPIHEQPHFGTASRRHMIDPGFVAMTSDWGNNFDDDSFSRSFRLEAPLMPKTGEI